MRGIQVGLTDAGVSPHVIRVESAGVAAVDGWPMCEVADTLTTSALGPGGDHRSRPLTPKLVTSADLILVADRGHRTAVTHLAPAARTRTFTIRQAARLATWVVGDTGVLDIAALKAEGGTPTIDPQDLRAAVPALPSSPAGRLGWLVAELDAARGLTPVADPGDCSEWDPDDIGDPHIAGWQTHELVASCTLTAAAATALAIGQVLAVP